MNDAKQQEWQKVSDQADESPLTQNLPAESPAGAIFEEYGDTHRKWLRIEIISGPSGARWAYWSGTIYPNPEFKAIADTIFNGDAAHFIGMLGVPYTRTFIPALYWILVEPRTIPPRTIMVLEDKPKERYEKSKEVYNVETHTSTKLP